MEQVTRPGDTSRNSWQVTHDWWLTLVSLIRILDLMNLKSVVVEQDAVLGVETVTKVISVKD